MELHKFRNIELGSLKDLHFPNMDITERVDARNGLLNLLPDDLWDKLAHQLLEVACGRVANHDLHHFGANLANLATLSVCGFLNLTVATLSKADGEHAQEVAIRGLNVDMSLNNGLPLTHERAELIPRKVHSVEVSEAGASLNLLALETDLTVGFVLGLLQVGERDFVDAALQGLGGDLGALRARHESLADLAHGEDGGRFDVVPLLAEERVHHLLAGSLALLGQTLVLADRLYRESGTRLF